MADGWAPTPHRVGTILDGRYRLLRCLAEGGMGAVYLAEELAFDAKVAVKIATSVPTSPASVRSEVRMLERLRHAPVVRVLEEGTTAEGEPYFAMEHLEGCDLGELLRREGPLDKDRTLRLLARLARALDSIHAFGVLHCDLKPGNIFVGECDAVTLIDFGLAVDRRTGSRDAPFLVLGTPEYMAPEQVLGVGGAVRAASDRYALAAVALEMLTGQRPYPSRTIGATLLSILESRPRLPSELGVLTRALDGTFATALSRDPDRRYPTALAFVDALESAVSLGCDCVTWTDGTNAPTVSMTPPARAELA